MQAELKDPRGSIAIEEIGGGRRRVCVSLAEPGVFSPRLSIETAYTPELIAKVLEVKGPAYLCDEIARDEDPAYVGGRLARMLLAYVPAEGFAGRRLLDFGCGSAASTMILGRALPETEIVGVELSGKSLELARARAAFYGRERVALLESPSGSELPPGIGPFDFVVMNAVYEHLLPEERRAVMPMLWGALRPGGVLFLDETPNRAYHVEGHTTGLPLLNQLPDSLAFAAAKLFSRRMRGRSWPELLRAGIRGGTEGEVVKMLTLGGGARAEVLEPTQGGLRDRLDLHYAGAPRGGALRQAHRAALRAIKKTTGVTYTRSLALAIRKSGAAD